MRPLCATSPIGASVVALASTHLGARLVQTSLGTTPLAIDCTVRVRLTGLTVARRRTYITHVDARTTIIPTLIRTITIVGA